MKVTLAPRFGTGHHAGGRCMEVTWPPISWRTLIILMCEVLCSEGLPNPSEIWYLRTVLILMLQRLGVPHPKVT